MYRSLIPIFDCFGVTLTLHRGYIGRIRVACEAKLVPSRSKLVEVGLSWLEIRCKRIQVGAKLVHIAYMLGLSENPRRSLASKMGSGILPQPSGRVRGGCNEGVRKVRGGCEEGAKNFCWR